MHFLEAFLALLRSELGVDIRTNLSHLSLDRTELDRSVNVVVTFMIMQYEVIFEEWIINED